MTTDTFSEQLLDRGNKRLARRQVETGESDVGGLQASGQWGCVVCLRNGDFLTDDVRGPKVVGFDGLGYAVWCDFCVGPGHGSVAVSDGPVALLLLDDCLFWRELELTFHAGVP